MKAGDLFVAIAGAKADGAHFARAAAAAGAVAVAAEQKPDGLPDDVAFVQVANARRALALCAAAFFPRQPPTIAAVTGTSGKTSVAAFTRQIWAALGHAAASLGTIGVVSPKGETYGSLTTPDPIELHRTLDALAGEGVTHLALEASSHGLDQQRLDGVRIAAGGFTNLSRDHLDYHPSHRGLSRRQAAAVRHADRARRHGGGRRRRLLCRAGGRGGEEARPQGDDGRGGRRRHQARRRRHRRLRAGASRSSMPASDYKIKLPLVGAFQVQNAARRRRACHRHRRRAARASLPRSKNCKAPKAGSNSSASANGAPIFIDYAHKPDALKKALEALRPYAKGRLIVVFGAGGDRDTGKRPIMGRIAHENADRVIVTDDNPRSEEPAAIRAAILAAAPGAAEIGDRGEAIRAAIGELKAGDVLLIAGKGHETGQIVGGRVLPFSDHDAVAARAAGATVA